MRSFIAVLLAIFAASWASAREAPLLAANPALEARVMDVAGELRCLVCQNETIAASHADLAVDLRQQIRNQLGEGRTSQQVIDFMVERYGEFVLYRPRFNATTWLLWLGPFVLLVVAGIVLVRTIRRQDTIASAHDLSAEQAARARELLAAAQEGRP